MASQKLKADIIKQNQLSEIKLLWQVKSWKLKSQCKSAFRNPNGIVASYLQALSSIPGGTTFLPFSLPFQKSSDSNSKLLRWNISDEDPWIGVETSVFWTSICPQKTIGWSCFQRDYQVCLCSETVQSTAAICKPRHVCRSVGSKLRIYLQIIQKIYYKCTKPTVWILWLHGYSLWCTHNPHTQTNTTHGLLYDRP